MEGVISSSLKKASVMNPLLWRTMKFKKGGRKKRGPVEKGYPRGEKSESEGRREKKNSRERGRRNGIYTTDLRRKDL